jgi:D-tyrosyl-tRNA(Tyr) deacylase
MRVVLQRVSQASVTIGGTVAGAIGRGFCLLVGFTHGDTGERVDWMADKVAGLRLFADADGKMNLGLADVQGALLVISQFTLYGDTARAAARRSSTRRDPTPPSPSTSALSPPSGPAGSRWPPANSEPTCWSRSTTTDP